MEKNDVEKEIGIEKKKVLFFENVLKGRELTKVQRERLKLARKRSLVKVKEWKELLGWLAKRIIKEG